MEAARVQQTVAREARIEGVGYWSGQDVTVRFRPAEESTGIVFVRRDLDPPVRIPASLSCRIDAARRTILQSGAAQVEMIEHVMAALAGLGVDNCEVWVDAAEMPGLDGSSQAVVEALDAAGIVAQSAPRPRLVVSERLRVGDQSNWVEARPPVGEGMSVEFMVDYGHESAIPRQRVALDVTPETFRSELAASRTFITKDEADWLRSQGLGARTHTKDLLVFDATGVIDNTLRFPDECARHKVLDLVGDLALVGCDLIGHFVAHRSGHQLNARLATRLERENSRQSRGMRRSA